MKPEEFVFRDGFLYIINHERYPYIDTKGMHEGKYSIDVLILDPEYDEPLTLEMIREKYPRVRKVLYESALKGIFFTYGNHGDIWEQTGETRGYA